VLMQDEIRKGMRPNDESVGNNYVAVQCHDVSWRKKK